MTLRDDLNSLVGNEFIGGTRLAPVAANFPHVQLFNPAASGIILIVKRIIASHTVTATIINLLFYNTPFAAVSGTVRNKLSGGVAPTAEMRTENLAARVGSMTWQVRLPIETFTEILLPSEPPIVLNAGEGIHVYPDAVNLDLNVSYSWKEIPG